MWIVWPKKIDTQTAMDAISSATFPLDALPDQDLYYIWKDMTIMLGDGSKYGEMRYKNIKWYKKFPYGIEYSSAASVVAIKQPILIFASDASPTNKGFTIQGYCKMSYKDV